MTAPPTKIDNMLLKIIRLTGAYKMNAPVNRQISKKVIQTR